MGPVGTSDSSPPLQAAGTYLLNHPRAGGAAETILDSFPFSSALAGPEFPKSQSKPGVGNAGLLSSIPMGCHSSNRPFLLRRKLEHSLLVECLARLQDCCWKIRVIRRIRKVLGFEAESVAAFVDVALLSRDGAVEEVSRIELDPGLRGGDLQHAAAGGFVHARG